MSSVVDLVAESRWGMGQLNLGGDQNCGETPHWKTGVANQGTDRPRDDMRLGRTASRTFVLDNGHDATIITEKQSGWYSLLDCYISVEARNLAIS